MFTFIVFATLLLLATSNNIRSPLPRSHARINIENFQHQLIGNPSVLAFNLFTDERGEEKNIFTWTAAKDQSSHDTLKLQHFDRDVLTFVRENVNSVQRAKQVKQRQQLLTVAPIGLDTSSTDDDGINEGSIGNYADRSFADVKAAAEVHHIQQAPYVDEDGRGVILAREIKIQQQLHVQGGGFLIVDSSDIQIQGIRQWKLVVDENFDDKQYGGAEEVIGWTAYSKYHSSMPNKRGHCGVNITPRTNFFLGPYQSSEVSKMFALPSDHTRVRINANFHFLDNWNDQVAYLKINDKIVWQKGHTMCGSLSVIPDFDEGCRIKGVDACGGKGVDRMG